ncbi:polysaccharide biosynthesis/export family protein [Thioclava indica]|uniref:Soluble ligand binding domain-containing protein n=1 Tax=Thioclava indica TaxID=1353528 RepID=A0A074JKT5_9RHOB|nr:polysaccharide biosynthesis/export family protein [Thioclava indica]KEO58241.1 hypothetical protein DT23_16705 [Thioclava indica]
MRASTSLLAATSALFLLASCSSSTTNFPIENKDVSSVADPVAGDVTIVRLTGESIARVGSPAKKGGGRTTLPSSNYWTYRVGTGDVLDVVVWEHPELTTPAGSSRTPIESGLRVQADGTFFYPYVGKVRARGRTAEEIRADLAEKLKEYIPAPQISVRVVGYNSQTASVTGEVGKPARIPLTDSPLTLLDAISDAGGLTETADARRLTVRRNGHSYSVDLQAFLDQGISYNNPILRNGDVVSVPRATPEQAYLLGEIDKPGAVDLTKDDINLTEALTTLGGLSQDKADARGIFVFRDTPSGMTAYQLDTSSAAAFALGTRFYLHPNDVVYVTTAPVAKWNRIISNLLPTLTTARTASLVGN